MAKLENESDENRHLRRTIRDLVALSTLPAVWTGLCPQGIAHSLADVLFETLSLDLVYIRMQGLPGEGEIEVFRSRQKSADGSAGEFRASLVRMLEAAAGDPPAVIDSPFGGGQLHLATTRFGTAEEDGGLVTGCLRAGYPDARDKMLLGAGANQTGITVKRLQAEARVREQGEQLRTTLASIGDAVITTDMGGRCTNLNAVAESLTGWSNAEAAGQPLEAVFHIVNERTRQVVANPAVRTIQGHAVGLARHTILIARDGTERPIDNSAAPIRNRNGEINGCVLVFRDVAEKRRSEQKLQASEERFRALLTATSHIVWTRDATGRFVSPQKSWSRYTGQTWEELKDFGWINAVHPADREELQRVWAEACASKTLYQSEGRLWHAASGRHRRYEVRGVPILNRDGTIREWVGKCVDVEDRWQAEEKLRERELRYRLVGQAANDAIWDWDLKTNQIFWNEGVQKLFGYRVEEAGATASWWSDHIHPDEQERVLHRIHEAIDNGEELWQDEYQFQRADGTFAVVFDRGRIVHENGQPIRMVGSMLDLTEKRKAEDDLREARSRLESALTAAEIGTWEFDPVRNIVQADANLARMFNVSPDDAGGMSLEFYTHSIHPDDQSQVAEAIQQALESGATFEAEYRIARENEDVRWVIARGRVERDGAGRAIRLPGVVVDITERKEIERALRESKEQLSLALDSTELGVWNIDPKSNHLQSDEQFRLIFHASKLPLTYEQAFAAIHPDDRERIREAVAAATRPVDPVLYAEEYRVVHPDGAVRWVFGKGRANFEQVGQEQQLTSFDGTVMDVTEQRQMREDLRELAARLSEADRRKDEFLATLAHELRNPLAPIRTGLEAMKMVRDDPETLEDIRCTMERQTQQLIKLVDDLLDVSRITKGKLELRRCRVNLADIIQSAVEASHPFMVEASHQLTVALPDEPVFLHADPNRLAQVLSNLLNNSTKYTPEGGGIRLTAERRGSQVVISVEDNGIGIPPEMLGRIFEMFAQIDRPQEKGYTGLGIGLSLVRSLVELHDGRIEVHSEGVGKGCVFRVHLPVLTAAVPEKPVPTPEAGRPRTDARRKVLVVDDNKVAASMLGMVVKMLGNEVRKAHDGLEATKLAADFLPDVILMDIGMPRMNGYEAARHIRAQPWGGQIMLVALTGWGQDEDRQRTREAGFDHHLVKPAEPADLQDLLASAPRGETPVDERLHRTERARHPEEKM
ncbi:MAG: PAS domain-containing protein [Planctomycetaceae bacterium]|nr:PAS domain-containing protein [Planctomycetaceae bacterium]